MRYLLDELMAYEEGFSDIMMDDRALDRHETFMGEDPSAPLCRADLSKFEVAILAKLQGLVEKAATPGISFLNFYFITSNGELIAGPTITTPANFSIATHPAPVASHPAPVSRSQSPEEPVQNIPQPTRIPETNTLDDALRYWEHGCPEKGLDIPLKKWSEQFKPSDYAKEAVKLGNIRFVCEEFHQHCGADFIAFEAKYPGLRKKFTMLMKAVRAQRKIRGDTKSRNRRK